MKECNSSVIIPLAILRCFVHSSHIIVKTILLSGITTRRDIFPFDFLKCTELYVCDDNVVIQTQKRSIVRLILSQDLAQCIVYIAAGVGDRSLSAGTACF